MENTRDFERISQVIAYLREHFREQPTLETIAAAVHMSPFHLQRLFTDWAGVSPKKFLQYISVEHAKKVLAQGTTIAALSTGLSGTGRLHDLFVYIESMTPGEYKNGGACLDIRYSFAETPFGRAILASTHRGVCYLAFDSTDEIAVQILREKFPNAHYREERDAFQEAVLAVFTKGATNLQEMKLHLKGTPFQIKVWEALLQIPEGYMTTYGRIAQHIHHPKAYRAVGSAVGDNPVSFLIPCHRVIQASGEMGNYHWGPTRKAAMLGWEMASPEEEALF